MLGGRGRDDDGSWYRGEEEYTELLPGRSRRSVPPVRYGVGGGRDDVGSWYRGEE